MGAEARDHLDVLENDDWMTAAAAAVLQRRLDGLAHPGAVQQVCASHALTRAEVERSWSLRKGDALAVLTVGRVVDACPWTEAEIAQLSQIFPDRP